MSSVVDEYAADWAHRSAVLGERRAALAGASDEELRALGRAIEALRRGAERKGSLEAELVAEVAELALLGEIETRMLGAGAGVDGLGPESAAARALRSAMESGAVMLRALDGVLLDQAADAADMRAVKGSVIDRALATIAGLAIGHERLARLRAGIGSGAGAAGGGA